MSNLKVYCQGCGFAHAYTLHKPNFCQSCGTSLGTVEKAAPERAGLELEEPSANFSNLSALDYESIDYAPDQQTLGQFMDQHSNQQPPVNPEERKSSTEGRSSEEVLKELKAEGSAIRPNYSS